VTAIISSPVNQEGDSDVSSVDIELASSIIDGALSVSTPTKEDRVSYMSTFSAMQKIKKRNLLVANEKDNSVGK